MFGGNSIPIAPEILVRHYHHAQKIYGLSAATNQVGYLSTIPFSIVGGNDVDGVEIVIHRGDVIESGSNVKHLDLNMLYVTSVDKANSPTIIQFEYGTMGTATASGTAEADDDVISIASHPFVDGDKIIFTTLTGGTGLSTGIVYFVRDAVAGVSFKVANVSGGAAINVTLDYSAVVAKKVTLSTLTETITSMSSTTNDALPINMQAQFITCDKFVSARAKSKSGDTTTLTFFLGLHTYQF